MDKNETLDLLYRLRDGSVTPEEALLSLKLAPFDDLGYAKVDHHRGIRQGSNEVIYGSGKTPERINGIIGSMAQNGAKNILVTRIDSGTADYLSARFPFIYYTEARIGVAYREESASPVGNIVIASGGTSDIAVCEEAAVTAEVLGSRVTRLYDVGVSGIHRLLSHIEEIMSARVIVAVAGMEGALASVIGGLCDCPVIAVPTSVGYGANFGGLSALLSMLNSCASGVSVVNIDNGFGAGYLANMINRM
jgi:NCAIR mutase (PurE)-related protein